MTDTAPNWTAWRRRPRGRWKPVFTRPTREAAERDALDLKLGVDWLFLPEGEGPYRRAEGEERCS